MKTYKSTGTDPKQSDGSYYGWVKVKNKKIVQVGTETLRVELYGNLASMYTVTVI